MPNIHEILSSVKTPQGLRLDREAIVEQAGHRFLQDRVTALDPASRQLLTAGGHELNFDACIVAVGALWRGWRRLAWPQLLSLADVRKLPDRRVVRML